MADTSLVKMSQLSTALTRVKTELDKLDDKTFSSAKVENDKLYFYSSTDKTGTPIDSVDLPVERFLDQTKTGFVQSFNFSSVTYSGATDPNLNGKPVLVLAVKGETAGSINYSFLNLETLIDTYTAANAGISIAGSSIGVQLSADAGNILSIANDGLKGEMKVTGATQGNFAIFGANGAIIDSGFAVAADSEITTMLTTIFGA